MFVFLPNPNASNSTADQSDDNASSDKTVQDVWDTFTDKQKEAVYALIGAAIGGSDGASGQPDVAHADNSEDSGDSGETVQDVFDTLNDEQKNVAYALIGMLS